MPETDLVQSLVVPAENQTAHNLVACLVDSLTAWMDFGVDQSQIAFAESLVERNLAYLVDSLAALSDLGIVQSQVASAESPAERSLACLVDNLAGTLVDIRADRLVAFVAGLGQNQVAWIGILVEHSLEALVADSLEEILHGMQLWDQARFFLQKLRIA